MKTGIDGEIITNKTRLGLLAYTDDIVLLGERKQKNGILIKIGARKVGLRIQNGENTINESQ